MKYKRSILHGYDKATEKLIADALHIPLKAPKTKSHKKMKRKHLKGVRHHENSKGHA